MIDSEKTPATSGTAALVPSASKKEASVMLANRSYQQKKATMSFRDDRDLEAAVRDQELKKTTWMATLALTYRTIGIIYGDIGTSPLYVYASTFLNGPPSNDNVLGLMSLIFWTITLVVVVKYLLIILSADDNGEGGTFALYSLITRHAQIPTPNLQMVTTADMSLSRYTSNSNVEDSKSAAATMKRKTLGEKVGALLRGSKGARALLLSVVLLATSMILGDGVLTPAISVISAVIGIQVAAPSITTGTIVGISCAILILLFAFQRTGTSKVGFTFAPIVLVWYGSNVMINLYNIITYYPGIFKALSPHYLFLYFIRNGYEGWYSLGGTLLCITGTEAMYADLGHFSKTSIRLGFLCVAYPSLIITYLGQAAYLMVNPQNVSTTFYSSIPSPVYWPMFVVSVMAAIVASQAMISGAFSIVKQSIALGCFPRLDIMHTSARVVGQIYVPVINWILMVLTVAVVAGFQNGTVIGNAYGVAVTFVMIITTNLMLLASMVVFNVNPLISLPIWALFVLIDGSYLSANVFKFLNGGWFPIALSIVIFIISAIWFYGRQRKSIYLRENGLLLENVLRMAPSAGGEAPVEDESEATLGGSKKALALAATGERVARVPGMGLVFSDTVQGVPPVFHKWLENISAVFECTVLVTVRNVPVSAVLPEERFLFKPIPSAPGFYRAVARYGYRDRVDLGDDFAAELQKEIALCVKPLMNSTTSQKATKMVYVMGETNTVPKPGSNFLRRFLLEGLYNPLALVTRSRNATWNVPRAHFISFTVELEV